MRAATQRPQANTPSNLLSKLAHTDACCRAKRRRCAKALRVLASILFVTAVASGQEAADFYQQNCAACHSIGLGPRVGPDLKDVTSRQSRDWLARFLLDPQAVVDSGDAYAKKIVAASGGMVMPKIPGIDRVRAAALLNHIDAQSKGAHQTSPAKESETPPAAEQVVRGKELVLGSKPLANGGPPCISCHTLAGLGALGGGRLGPDLTGLSTRLGGRKNLAAWLSTPPTPVMQAVFKARPLTADEIGALAAYFDSVSKETAPAHASARGTFLLIGFGGSLVGLALFEAFWRKRFRAVRRPLVARRQGK